MFVWQVKEQVIEEGKVAIREIYVEAETFGEVYKGVEQRDVVSIVRAILITELYKEKK